MIVNEKFHSISTLPYSQLTVCRQTNFSFHAKESFSPFKSFVVYLLCFLPFLCVSLAAPFHAATNKSTVFPTTANSNVDTEYNHVTKADQVADAFHPLTRPALLEKKTILDVRVETKNGINKVSFNRDPSPDDNDNNNDSNNNNNNDNENEEVARILTGLLEATPSMDEDGIGHETRDRRKRAVTQALCPIKQGKHGEDEIAQLTRSTCTQTIAQSMCEEDERMEVRRGEIRPLGAERSAAVYYGHDLCFSFFSRGATKTDGCMSMCMQKDREYEVSLDVSGYTRTYWTLKFTGDCYFCGFSQPLTVVACVFLSIVVIAATCCVCCRTDPSRQLSTMHQAMQQQMQKIVNSRNPPAEEAKNPPEEEEQFQADAGAENLGDVTIDDDNLNVTRDDDNLNVTRDDDNLNATRDTRSRGSPSGTRASPSMQSRSEFAEAVTPSAPVADDSRLFDESKDWTDREC